MATTGKAAVTTTSDCDVRRGPLVSKEHRYRLISIISPFLLLILWEITVRVGVLDIRFFPPPTQIFVILAEMMISGELFEHIGISFQRIALGFILSSVPGILLGLLVGWSRGVRAFVDPIIAATYPIPKIAILPLPSSSLDLARQAKSLRWPSPGSSWFSSRLPTGCCRLIMC